MIDAIQKLAEALPLESNYKWEIPEPCPIAIPNEVEGNFERNIYLKENLGERLRADPRMDAQFWVIQKWGKIESFKDNEKNRGRIDSFGEQIQRRQMTRDNFNVIASLSKTAAFRDPAAYSIYDSRAIHALNWLLFCHATDPLLFPQPPGRGQATELDAWTVFELSDRTVRYHSFKTAYFEYCDLLKKLAATITASKRPYLVEMLLFVAAEKWVGNDIRRRTKVLVQRGAL